MHPRCLISHTIRKNTEQVGRGTGTELGFIRQIKWQADKAEGVGGPLAMTQIQSL